MIPKLEFGPPLEQPSLELGPHEEWMGAAACRGLDPELFFPETGQPSLTSAAKAVCKGCVVVEECLDYAIRNKEKQGVWGRTSERQRRIIRKERRYGTTE